MARAASLPFLPSAALSALRISPMLLPTLTPRTPLTLFLAPVGLVAIASPHWLRPPAASRAFLEPGLILILRLVTSKRVSLPPSLQQAPESPHSRRHAYLPLRRRLAPPIWTPGCHSDRGGPCGRPALHAQVTSPPSAHLGAQTTPAVSATRPPRSLLVPSSPRGHGRVSWRWCHSVSESRSPRT
jgi:hypothetical protein